LVCALYYGVNAEYVAKDDSMAKNPPKQGEGPSKEERENGFYDVMFVGDAPDGTRIRAMARRQR